MATSSANRGKVAEKKVNDALKSMNDHNAGFTFNRQPDAHAAGGRFQPLPGDFQAFCLGHYNAGRVWTLGPATDPGLHLPAPRNFIIEVKEVKHDFRVPAKNYSEDKVARVQKRVWAGTEAIVAVLHTTTMQWRLVPLEVFVDRSKPSWDLRGFPALEVPIGQALADWMEVKP